MTTLLLALLFITSPRAARPVMEIMARELLSNFVAGRFEAATKDFNSSMKENVTPAVLADLKKQVEAEVGAFQHITEVHRRKEGGFPAIELTIKYEKAPVSMRVVFDQANRIGNVTMSPIRPEPVDPKLEAAARELLADFAARRFEAVTARFDPAMRTQLPAGGLAKLHGDVTDVFGAYRSVTAVRQETGEYRVIDLTAAYERSPVTVRVVFDKAGRVAGLSITPFVAK